MQKITANRTASHALTIGQRVTARGQSGTVIEIRKSGWCLVTWDSGDTFRELSSSLRSNA